MCVLLFLFSQVDHLIIGMYIMTCLWLRVLSDKEFKHITHRITSIMLQQVYQNVLCSLFTWTDGWLVRCIVLVWDGGCLCGGGVWGVSMGCVVFVWWGVWC